VLPEEYYTYLFATLHAQSEKTLNMFYNDTKRLRNMLAVNWNEAEFRTFLASAEWTQGEAQSPPKSRGAASRSDALGQILSMAREHPWAVGAATMLEIMARDASLGRQDSILVQRWAGLLHALQKRGVSQGAVVVVLIEQLADDVPHHDHWVEHWRQFVRLTAGSGLPFLVVWTGTRWRCSRASGVARYGAVD
jgi:hypothetical protein